MTPDIHFDFSLARKTVAQTRLIHHTPLNYPQNPSTTYSVQIFLETTQDQASFQVIWDRKAENWTDGSPPPDMTYNLMASKNTMLYTDPMFDPDHTLQ